MADWYVSSAAWALIAQFAASGVYTVGQIVRPLTAPAVGHEYAFRCTTAGTAGAEPAWPAADGSTVTTGGATFTNVSGRSAYGWSAAAGTTYSISTQSGNNRPAAGDRIFLSSDHVEALSVSYRVQFGSSNDFGLIQIVSVNRGGSVPPAAADAQSGANIGTSNSLLYLDGYQNIYWQGVTFTMLGASNMNWQINNSNNKANYFKNCAFVFNSGASSNITSGQSIKVVLDNTTFQFGNAAQSLYFANNTQCDFSWINTPNALQGATFPSALFVNSVGSGIATVATLRGVDLSALTGTILKSGSSGQVKLLLDSCKIASGVTRLGSVASTSPAGDEIELVNCYDGTNVLNERHAAAGDLTTDRVTYLTSGAQDDLGNYSLKLISSSRSDFVVLPLDAFTFDVENTVIGVSKTATVEVVSSATLNNNDLRLLLEYMGGGPVTWDAVNFATGVTYSNNNLTATPTANNTGTKATVGHNSGKYYIEFSVGVWGDLYAGPGLGSGLPGNGMGSPGFGTGSIGMGSNGQIWLNNSYTGQSLGSRSNGDVIGLAVDLGANRAWWRIANPLSGWLGASGAGADPVAGTGGFDISSIAGTQYPMFYVRNTGGYCTAKFSPGSLVAGVPSGFIAGWPGSTSDPTASFADSLASVLTAASALPTSSNSWTMSGTTFWNPGDQTGMGFSSNYLSASGGGSPQYVRAIGGASTGKYYFEATAAFPNVTTRLGLSSPSASTSCLVDYQGNFPGGNSGGNTGGNIVCFAVDLGAHLIWIRSTPATNWNNSGTANPATGTGGISISTLTGTVFPYFAPGSTGDTVTANFGGSTFSGVVPSGFNPFPMLASQSKQLLQVAFTPQRAGRVRGLVRLGKPSAAVWVNPQIAIT